MIDDLTPTLRPVVNTIVQKARERGWLVRYLVKDSHDEIVAWLLIRPCFDETQVIVLSGPDNAAAFRTRDYAFEKAAEGATTVIWSTIGTSESIVDAVNQSQATIPYPRPDNTFLPHVAGATWAWLWEWPKR